MNEAEQWIDKNIEKLELEWYNRIPPEEQPIDDDIIDYFNNHPEEFLSFCMNKYNERDKLKW